MDIYDKWVETASSRKSDNGLNEERREVGPASQNEINKYKKHTAAQVEMETD